MPASPVSVLRRVVIALVLVQCSSHAWAETVVVFTDARHRLTSTGNARVFALDAPAQIEAALSLSLPPDADRATVLVRQRLAQNPEFSKQLSASYQGVLEAFLLGIEKIPAVVVDRKFVIYGEPDVEAALSRIAAYRSGSR